MKYKEKKLDEKYTKRIVDSAEDKLTIDIDSRKITDIINRELKKIILEIQKEK